MSDVEGAERGTAKNAKGPGVCTLDVNRKGERSEVTHRDSNESLISIFSARNRNGRRGKAPGGGKVGAPSMKNSQSLRTLPGVPFRDLSSN